MVKQKPKVLLLLATVGRESVVLVYVVTVTADAVRLISRIDNVFCFVVCNAVLTIVIRL